MGYTTEFFGQFKLSKAATAGQVEYLNTLSGTRRMQRDNVKLMSMYKGKFGHPDIKGMPYGEEGEFFAKDDNDFGQKDDGTIIDYNNPPKTQPGLWCKWHLTDDGLHLEWDGNEKFYDYTEWLNYLIINFFSKWGITLSGTVEYIGEDRTDRGTITISKNKAIKNEA